MKNIILKMHRQCFVSLCLSSLFWLESQVTWAILAILVEVCANMGFTLYDALAAIFEV